MERRVQTAWLLDFYGPLLTERQQALLHMHYEEDLSLAEIAEQEGISRQGAHDAVRRGERQLASLEQRLGLLARHRRVLDALEACRTALQYGSANAQNEALRLIETAMRDEEGLDGI